MREYYHTLWYSLWAIQKYIKSKSLNGLRVFWISIIWNRFFLIIVNGRNSIEFKITASSITVKFFLIQDQDIRWWCSNFTKSDQNAISIQKASHAQVTWWITCDYILPWRNGWIEFLHGLWLRVHIGTSLFGPLSSKRGLILSTCRLSVN